MKHKSHVSVLILKVWLPIVACNPVCVCAWSWLWLCTRYFPVKSVIHSLEETFSEVEVSNWVDWLFKLYTSWNLSIPIRPVMFNAFEMPLIDDNNYLFMRTPINFLEEAFISLIDKDMFKLWEEDIQWANIPIYQVLIQAFLSKDCRSSHL